MKLFKILSVLLACVIILGGFGMCSVSAAQYDSSPLQNTFYKLKTEKKLEIRYIGGSVTGGHGSSSDSKTWRALTTKWFRDTFPEATINAARMSIGNQGTIFALHRVENAILNKGEAPDLVFIETAVNDGYDGFASGDKLRTLYESLIKKIYNKNPKCDIVIVLTGNNSTMKEARKTGVPYRPEHRDVASYYNLPVVDVGAALYQKIYQENGNADAGTGNDVWKTYFKDSVHPIDAGYAEYAKTIQNYLTGELVSKNLDSSVYANKNIPQKTYMQNLELDAYNVDFSSFTNPNFAKVSYTQASEISTYKNVYKGISLAKEGDSFTVEFTGTAFRIWTNNGNSQTSITYSVDGGSRQSLKLTASNHKVYSLAEGLSSGKHKIKIRYGTSSNDVYIYSMFISGDPAMSGNVNFTFESSDELIDDGSDYTSSTDSPSSSSSSTGGTSSSTVSTAPPVLLNPTGSNSGQTSEESTSSKSDKCTHDFCSWCVSAEATCIQKGAQSRTCLICGYTENKYSDYGNHVFENPEIITQATIYSTGLETGKCTICGKTEEQEIPCNMTDSATQIYVETKTGTFSQGTELKVNKLSNSDADYSKVKKAVKSISTDFSAFNISSLLDGKSVQPNGELKIAFPVPTGYDDIAIYQINGKSQPVKLDVVISLDGSAATVTVTELGTFVICNATSVGSSANNSIMIWAILIGVALLLAIAAIVFYVIKKKLIVLPIVAIVIVIALLVGFLISLM